MSDHPESGREPREETAEKSASQPTPTSVLPSAPSSFQSSIHYQNQLGFVGGDHSLVVLPPEFSDFSPEVDSAADLRRHVVNMDYWQVVEVDRAFFERARENIS